MRSLVGFWRSSVGKQAIAAASGLCLFGWLVLHAAGNSLAFAGPAAIDGYAASLAGAPLLLWAARIGLGLVLVLHVAAVTSLARRARAAHPKRARPSGRTPWLVSRSLRIGGVALAVFVVLHLLHLTFGTLHPSFERTRVYSNLVSGLAVPWVAVSYVLVSLLVGLHLLHGLWASSFSLGVRRSSSLRRPLGLTLALALSLGLAAVPLAVLLGVIR